jgi:hypothetical protein
MQHLGCLGELPMMTNRGPIPPHVFVVLPHSFRNHLDVQRALVLELIEEMGARPKPGQEEVVERLMAKRR